jgi:hypothetical protein
VAALADSGPTSLLPLLPPQNEVETWFTGKLNMLAPYHNLYWTGGSVVNGARCSRLPEFIQPLGMPSRHTMTRWP